MKARKSNIDLIDTHQYQTGWIAPQLLDQDDDLQPWFQSNQNKTNKYHDNSSGRQNKNLQNTAHKFLAGIRKKKKSIQKDVEIIPQIQPIEVIVTTPQANKTQPIEHEIQQIGKIKQKENTKNNIQMQLNTTQYSYFGTKNDKNSINQFTTINKDQHLFKSNNLQKILRMKEKIRKKNHSQVQKIKLISTEGYVSNIPKLNKKQKQHLLVKGTPRERSLSFNDTEQFKKNTFSHTFYRPFNLQDFRKRTSEYPKTIPHHYNEMNRTIYI